MDGDRVTCASDERGELVVIVDTAPHIEPSAPSRYSLEQFAGAVGAALAPHDIAVRTQQSRDGARLLTAWRVGMPQYWYVVPINAQYAADGVASTASAIKRVLDYLVTD